MLIKDEFVKELLNDCKADYDLFVSFQNIVLEIFDITHTILTKNNIKYFAAYGSLLGVIRDSNIIPWDYDYDIIISIDDALKVQDALERELPDKYYIVSNFNNHKFPYYQMRVGMKGYDHRLHLDIFYYFGIPDIEDEIIKTKDKVLKLFERRQKIKPVSKTYYWKRDLYNKIIWILNLVKNPFENSFSIDKKIYKLLHKYPIDNASNMGIFCEAFFPVKKIDLGNPQLIKFNSHTIFVPERVDKVLESCYKNFEEYPPSNVRIKEYKCGLDQIKDIINRSKRNNSKDIE